jgi:hypothetical protein
MIVFPLPDSCAGTSYQLFPTLPLHHGPFIGYNERAIKEHCQIIRPGRVSKAETLMVITTAGMVEGTSSAIGWRL